ncbi:hypothetical protein [Aminobacter sp. AP02]|uniref:hypothetical protein n=1 Tax=Aminobacter sp. AP02 TaxID=2135737 RepID=UPI0011B1E5E9|nr:hypothetical protein [Aminobacter sp. AP02]
MEDREENDKTGFKGVEKRARLSTVVGDRVAANSAEKAATKFKLLPSCRAKQPGYFSSGPALTGLYASTRI